MAFIALCAVINIVGSNIALVLKLPVYFDSLGTVMCAVLFGPLYGMIPGLLSGLLVGFTTDIYSLFFMPAGILLGFVTGLIFHSERFDFSKRHLWLCAFLITLPSTLLASCISAFLFGGITSSGSGILVQLLHKAGLNLTASVFFVQFLTDYADRLLLLTAAVFLIDYLPKAFVARRKKG